MYIGHDNRRDHIYEISKDFLAEKQVQTIIDFGARHGEGLEKLSSFCTQYVFIEPSPRCSEYIRSAIEAVPNKICHVYNCVFGANVDTVKFNILETDDDQSGNLYTDRDGAYGKAEIIDVEMRQVRGLYKFKDESGLIPFIKMNIEGGEYDLLENTDLFDNVNMFCLEAHNRHVKGRDVNFLIEALSQKFDIKSYGDLNYKYCFLTGIKK